MAIWTLRSGRILLDSSTKMCHKITNAWLDERADKPWKSKGIILISEKHARNNILFFFILRRHRLIIGSESRRLMITWVWRVCDVTRTGTNSSCSGSSSSGRMRRREEEWDTANLAEAMTVLTLSRYMRRCPVYIAGFLIAFPCQPQLTWSPNTALAVNTGSLVQRIHTLLTTTL